MHRCCIFLYLSVHGPPPCRRGGWPVNVLKEGDMPFLSWFSQKKRGASMYTAVRILRRSIIGPPPVGGVASPLILYQVSPFLWPFQKKGIISAGSRTFTGHFWPPPRGGWWEWAVSFMSTFEACSIQHKKNIDSAIYLSLLPLTGLGPPPDALSFRMAFKVH